MSSKQYDTDNDEETEMERVAVKERSSKKEYLHFLKYIGDKKAKLGESVRFKTIIIAKPVVYVQWRFNGEYIQEGNDNFEISSKGNHFMFTVKKMSPDMVGSVEVVARNNVGVACLKVKLELEE